jgi:hypothetical protein
VLIPVSLFQPFGTQRFGDFSSNTIETTAKSDNRWGDTFDDPVFSEPLNSSKPSEQKSANADPFSGQGRYAGLDFYEDPFKNSNYRYADPFEENANTDPFVDPFNAPESQVFGSDPFSNNGGSDPFKSGPASDPFSPVENTYENSSLAKNDPFAKSEGDPFGKPDQESSSDPFGNSFTANFKSAPNVDPFGSNNNFGSSNSYMTGNDPFSLTNLKPLASSSDINSNSSKPTVSSTNSTVSYRKEKASSEATVSDKSSKKKSSHSLSDFLTGSPLKSDKGDKSKEKKDKKHGKFHLTSPLKTHKKSAESPKSDKKNKSTASSEAADEVQLKMAAEMSKRSDDDRRRKLQLQEEADLAYAIALSKAEAASLKTQ